jgi:surface antigen
MPAPAPAVPARAAPQTACHEYQTTAVIDGKTQPIWGRVCQQPDGSWRIAN